jgi:rhodanese-related sulfurtransferase
MNRSISPIVRCIPALSWSAVLLAAMMLAGNAIAGEEGESPLSVSGTESVTTAEAFRLHQAGVAFVDVRNPRLYARRHIPGAHHLDLYTDFSKATLAAIVAPDQPVVLYCSGIKCSRSSTAAEFAVDWGYTGVKYFREGIVGWRDAGHPMVESSP